MEEIYKRYLETEREIALFRATSLRSIYHKNKMPSTKRLISIEEEFLSIKFEEISSTIIELLEAIDMFRDSRKMFYDKYSVEPLVEEEAGGKMQTLLDLINNEILHEPPKDISSSEKKIYSRTMVILSCIKKYIEESLEKIKLSGFSINENDLLLDISERYPQDIFRFYNAEIQSFKSPGFRPIKELLKIPFQCNAGSQQSIDIALIKMRTKNVYGIYLPIKHVGRETSKPYYLNMICDDGLNISKLFSSNTRAFVERQSGICYRFIYLRGLPEIADDAILLESYFALMEKMIQSHVILIDNDSYFLIPGSRTEDDYMKTAFDRASAIFSNLLTKIV